MNSYSLEAKMTPSSTGNFVHVDDINNLLLAIELQAREGLSMSGLPDAIQTLEEKFNQIIRLTNSVSKK